METKIILLMVDKYTSRFPKCPEAPNNKYLLNRLVLYNSDIWSDEIFKIKNYFKIHPDILTIYNSSDVYYLSDTVQDLLSSNDKVKIDLALNIINTLYKTKI